MFLNLSGFHTLFEVSRYLKYMQTRKLFVVCNLRVVTNFTCWKLGGLLLKKKKTFIRLSSKTEASVFHLELRIWKWLRCKPFKEKRFQKKAKWEASRERRKKKVALTEPKGLDAAFKTRRAILLFKLLNYFHRLIKVLRARKQSRNM